jgi:hypothetical protein
MKSINEIIDEGASKKIMEVPFYMANQKNNTWQNLLPTQKSNKETFEMVVQFPAVEPTKYFEKLKNADGSAVIGEDGRPKRSPNQSGWVFTLVRFGTAETVKIVLKENYELNPAVLYQVDGLGYHFKKEKTFYIDEVTNFAVVHDFREDG